MKSILSRLAVLAFKYLGDEVEFLMHDEKTQKLMAKVFLHAVRYGGEFIEELLDHEQDKFNSYAK